MAPQGGASGGKYPKAFFVAVAVVFMAVYSSPKFERVGDRDNETDMDSNSVTGAPPSDLSVNPDCGADCGADCGMETSASRVEFCDARR
jgi:hypothetical protein